ncbi:S9 family peptidase [Photobacterium kishitanii]|uniref:prolyl oligopeptidase family serine peptidase n=1 Tax=Photobacterium kishitanii TaxID=318456 RepID=UPI000D154767|nr:prolyl oligopeptidase family serine peptidase [Photobacterium kishitanii]PSW71475.1 S9 family peptidase [Photobacterium kishitanii]
MFLAPLVLAHMLVNNDCDECWLRDETRAKPRVIDFLVDHNQQAEKYLASLSSGQEKLLSEWENMPTHKADQPWNNINGHKYKIINNGYGILVTDDEHTDKVIVDFNQRAKNYKYYRHGNWSISPDLKKIIITENTVGDDNYTVTVLDVTSGKVIYRSSQGYSDNVIWANDNNIIIIKNSQLTYRPYKVESINLVTTKKHVLFNESDPKWLVSSYVTTDNKFIVIQSNDESSSEQYLIPRDNITQKVLVRARLSGVEYYVDSVQNQRFIKSNKDGSFAIYRVGKHNDWLKIIDPKSDIERWFISNKNVILQIKDQGQTFLNSYDHDGNILFSKKLSADASVGWLANNTDANNNVINIRTMGLKQPAAWQAIDINKGNLVSSSADTYQSFDADNYTAKQITVMNGSVHVPVSLIFRNDKVSPLSPVILYGYGSYGVTMRPYFMPQIISLADKGAIYAIAHVRGGGFNGEEWHKAGSGIYRQNSISDFIAVAKKMQHYSPIPLLANKELKAKRDILAIGASAGGTLVAAAINQQPQLFTAAVLQVPFVDVLTSMSDSSLPLTSQQYQEWGNPNNVQQRKIIADYSPFDNIKSQPYPPILVRSGLYDSRVPFWEAAKYIAKIKKNSTVTNPYLLLTDLKSGHNTDGKKALSQQAMDYMFLLNQSSLNK